MEIIEVYKVRFLDWEVSIGGDRQIFYLRAFTKRGALRKGRKYIEQEEVWEGP